MQFFCVTMPVLCSYDKDYQAAKPKRIKYLAFYQKCLYTYVLAHYFLVFSCLNVHYFSKTYIPHISSLYEYDLYRFLKNVYAVCLQYV